MADDDKVLKEWQEPELLWDQKRARRMVWKARFRLWWSVIHALLIVWFCYAVYMMAIYITYSKLGKESELIRFATTLIETHYSGLRVDKNERVQTTLSPWLTQETTLTLYKQIGRWEMVVGTVKVKEPLFGEVTYDIDYDRKYLDEQHYGTFDFAVPPQWLGHGRGEKEENERVWEQLKHVEDGYVAELAFSTLDPFTPEQLRQRLAKYDLDILQMPVYAGEMKTFQTSYYASMEYSYVPHLALRPKVEYDQDGRGMEWESAMNDPQSVEAAVNRLIPDLQWLLAQGEYPDKSYDAQRLAYLQKNGVQVYGAVVTGPVRELEKLRQEPQFHDFMLGRIEIWNW